MSWKSRLRLALKVWHRTARGGNGAGLFAEIEG
jgi:hypothetical protein